MKSDAGLCRPFGCNSDTQAIQLKAANINFDLITSVVVGTCLALNTTDRCKRIDEL